MPLLHEMISLIVFRRALRVIYENGYPRTSTDFADLLRKEPVTIRTLGVC
jgi:hypothetical protein